MVCQVEGGFDVTLNVEVVVNVGFFQLEFAGREKHRAQCSRVLENQCETRLLFHSPSSAVPKPNLKSRPTVTSTLKWISCFS